MYKEHFTTVCLGFFFFSESNKSDIVNEILVFQFLQTCSGTVDFFLCQFSWGLSVLVFMKVCLPSLILNSQNVTVRDLSDLYN